MRIHEMALVAVLAIVVLTAFVARFTATPDECAAPSPRSVVSLFAPCLQQQAMSDPSAASER
jgi:hypothetical protein